MEDKYRFFISYKSDDVVIVRTIAELLMANDVSVWMNEYCVRHDLQDHFQELINRGIDSSEFGVLFVSDRFADSPYCQVEVERLLRRMNSQRIVVIALEDSDRFQRLYPEFNAQIHFSGRNIPAITKAIETQTGIRQPTQLKWGMDDLSEPVSWRVYEAGFTFSDFPLVPHFGSRFQRILRHENNELSNEERREFTRFEGDYQDSKVELLFNYDIYDTPSDIVHRAENEPDAVRVFDAEQDERARLRDEMTRYEDEVDIAINEYRNSLQLWGKLDEIGQTQEIGVHMYTSIDRGVAYKHRLYSFRVPSLGKTFRSYKLVLNHPQHKKLISVRFIFTCSGLVTNFFRMVPVMDRIVESFRWINEDHPATQKSSQELIRGAKYLFDHNEEE